MRPPGPPPDEPPPRSRLTRWLDRHAHPASRTSRSLDLVRAVTQVLTLAGLIALVVQRDQDNITAKRDASNRSVEASLLIEPLELDTPDLACALLPAGPERQLALSALRAMRYLELNLDLHERLWQQHQDGIFSAEEWEPWQRWFHDAVVTGELFPAVWTWDRDDYQADFARYVDAVVADELARRAAATVAAGGRPPHRGSWSTTPRPGRGRLRPARAQSPPGRCRRRCPNAGRKAATDNRCGLPARGDQPGLAAGD